MVSTVAALYVATNGCYFGLDGVEPWDVKRDAMKYEGPHPVIAHPPCSRWCRLAALNESRWGAMRGDDGGTFAAALASVREHGGVLEHPAYSDAWPAFSLRRPDARGGWKPAGDALGWVCHVEQQAYGHDARKATWLYACRTVLPALRWGNHGRARALVSACTNHSRPDETRPRIMKREAERTPSAFLDVLLQLARSVAYGFD